MKHLRPEFFDLSICFYTVVVHNASFLPVPLHHVFAVNVLCTVIFRTCIACSTVLFSHSLAFVHTVNPLLHTNKTARAVPVLNCPSIIMMLFILIKSL